mgnify:CR=1 FL=1
MNYATIKYYDIANGPGVRTSVFVSGCRHHCPGCFNAVAWDFDYGQPFTEETEKQLLDMLDEIRTRYDLSILLSTHDFATLGQFADKVILLKGTVLRVGPPDEVLASPEFQEVFHLNLGKGNLGKGGRG